MKRILLSALVFLCLMFPGFAQEKIFETKITANPFIGFGATKQLAVYAGAKNYNVVQLTDGKIVTDKSYKDAGVSLSKVADTDVSDDLGKLVLCDKTTMSCIDVKTGTKAWEIKSFTNLDNDQGSLMIFGSYVIAIDQKAKDNFSLTCLSLNDGKELWSLAGEKNRIRTAGLYYIPSCSTLGLLVEKTGLFRLIDLQTGKAEASQTIEGSPVYSYLDETTGNIYMHHRVSEENSYVSAISMKDKKFIWKAKSGNVSPQTPMTMNTDVYTYYAKISTFDNKVLLITEGIEAFDAASGKLLYDIPFVPYYKWGVGHYTNGIFEPVVTSYGILIADRTSGDMYIKLMDKNTGKQIWSSDKLKDMDSAPNAVLSGDNAAIQFGGLNYFEVMNNTGIGKLLKPFTITSFDLKTGKVTWSIESKKDFYYITPANENVLIVGTKEFQTVDPASGTIVKIEKNSFREDYFMTKFDLSSTHKLQKNVEFDFSQRRFLLLEEGKLSLSSF